MSLISSLTFSEDKEDSDWDDSAREWEFENRGGEVEMGIAGLRKKILLTCDGVLIQIKWMPFGAIHAPWMALIAEYIVSARNRRWWNGFRKSKNGKWQAKMGCNRSAPTSWAVDGVDSHWNPTYEFRERQEGVMEYIFKSKTHWSKRCDIMICAGFGRLGIGEVRTRVTPLIESFLTEDYNRGPGWAFLRNCSEV